MYDFKPGDKVQIDPALVISKLLKRRGIGTVLGTRAAGTEAKVIWSGDGGLYTFVPTRDLVPVAGTFREAER